MEACEGGMGDDGTAVLTLMRGWNDADVATEVAAMMAAAAAATAWAEGCGYAFQTCSGEAG